MPPYCKQARRYLCKYDAIFCKDNMLNFFPFQPPSIGTLAEAFGRRFGEEKLIRMEQRLLAESFKLDISIPTRLAFSSVFVKAGQLSDKERLLVEFLVYISYLDFNLFYIKASKVSAACVHLALQVESTINFPPFVPFLIQ
jgi:hypothetical protein